MRWTTKSEDAARRWYDRRTDLDPAVIVARGAFEGLWPRCCVKVFCSHVYRSRRRAEARGELVIPRSQRGVMRRVIRRTDLEALVKRVGHLWGDKSRSVEELAALAGVPSVARLRQALRQAKKAGLVVADRAPGPVAR